MASLRRYDVQAKIGLIVSCAAILGSMGLAGILLRNYHHGLRVIVYGSKSYFGPLVFLTTALTLLLAATGAALGANSAGQRRNEKNKLSWVAFFVGVASISLTVVLFVGFYAFRMVLG
jgi:hypothetical protein